jgi:hypothetical protein
MVPRTPSNPRQRAPREPLFDVHPQTGASIEVFYADRALETFGRCAPGWFWWSRRRGWPPDGLPIGPFATSYSAYRHALGTESEIRKTYLIKSATYLNTLAEREGFSARVPWTSKTEVKSAFPDNHGGLCVPALCTGTHVSAQAESSGW